MTEETRKAILQAYNDHKIATADIAAKYGITKAAVTKIAVEEGARPRRPKAYGKRANGKGKLCPKCHKIIEVKGAKFCYFCGADMRSAKDLLIERVDKAFEIIKFLPESFRDEIQQLFIAIIKELGSQT